MVAYQNEFKDTVSMSRYCQGCSPERRPAHKKDNELGVHKAMVIAGSLSNAQRRTLGFETSKTFGSRRENQCDLVVNIGSKALLSFLYEEDRPMLGLDTWRGRSDNAICGEQMTSHMYNFSVLAIDEPTALEVQHRGDEKLYGLPLYIIQKGLICLREPDPDGSMVMLDIERIS
jgi:hypothetical protein